MNNKMSLMELCEEINDRLERLTLWEFIEKSEYYKKIRSIVKNVLSDEEASPRELIRLDEFICGTKEKVYTNEEVHIKYNELRCKYELR